MSENQVVGTVVSLRAFPVKSMDAGPLARADVLASGVRHDRGWAVLDESGDVVTSRTSDALRTVRADVTDGGPAITVPGSEPVTGAAADAALSQLVGRPVTVRASTGAGFNEVAPVHLVSRQAIERGADHDDHGEQCPCSVEEPRANLVLDLAGEPLETGWVGARLRIGGAVLQVSKAPRHCLGVYADVVTEGAVAEGDEVVLTRD
jgi:uncharacterized protein YcbX